MSALIQPSLFLQSFQFGWTVLRLRSLLKDGRMTSCEILKSAVGQMTDSPNFVKFSAVSPAMIQSLSALAGAQLS
jgi:hypothetical protein